MQEQTGVSRPVAGTVITVDGSPPGQRLEFWLGKRCRRERELAGLNIEDVASAYGGAAETWRRFELGHHRANQEETMVACYAQICGIGDPRKTIYQPALGDWLDQGDPPQAKKRRRPRPFDDLPPLGNGQPT